ncbi:long-chain fatty acid--CoA ligase [Dietzia sp. ANT_WB102]|uniref:AMP-dependent synthetase/ligase n=1 Tax=Dietzia sp. ANT_WB102 TaxID=2597345 RepID=UPI0011EDCF20|nr:long-chain fatty acid--CoA ligase [Dietzia sp. ANT_WB102]KAA0918158.1 long-chain fatty acid--CoA ligase [Dietzia sp. ANT_WB102]
MTTEFATPPASKPFPEQNLARLVFTNAQEAPNDIAVLRLVGSEWKEVTCAEYLEEIKGVAKGLIARGVTPGDRLAIMSHTRYEWSLIAWAAWTVGAVTVPIYETSSSTQCDWILTDSGASFAVVENPELRETLTAETEWQGDLLLIEDDLVEQLIEAGASVSDEELEKASLTMGQEDPCAIIYTSGTTGNPKGCEILHGGFGGVVVAVEEQLQEAFVPNSRTLIFLPLAHVLARILEVACFYKRVTVAHEPDTTKVVERLGEIHPTFLVSVPRVLEKVYNSAASKAETAGGAKAKIFKAAVQTAIDYSKALEGGGKPSAVLALKQKLFSKLVYSKLHDALGGECDRVISGGSPLGARLGHFFRGAGFDLLEGYGLTESSGVLTVNPVNQAKIGTVGRPIPGVTIQIADDGEVLAKAKTLFKGYWNNPQANEESWTGDWYHTGDIGELDSDGYLSITGRKKDLIVTAGGKNVSPAQLEDLLTSDPLISQAVVVGDNRSYVAALVTIDPETFPGWRDRNGKTGEVADLLQDGDLVGAVQDAVDRANRSVSRAESIRKFNILSAEFTVEGGELTPTLKLKRNVVHERFADEIEQLYAG